MLSQKIVCPRLLISIRDAVNRWALTDLVAVLTVVVLLRNSHSIEYVGLTLAAALAFFAWPVLRRTPYLYAAIVVVWTPRLIWQWYDNEDHVYLAIYWCAAVALCLATTNFVPLLATNARLFIGLAFGIAFAWKVLSPEFVQTDLFQHKLIYDFRFRELVTCPIGGLSPSDAAHNVMAQHQLQQLALTSPVVTKVGDVDMGHAYPAVTAVNQLSEPAENSLAATAATDMLPSVPVTLLWNVGLIAVVMTVWTVVIEGFISLGFLLHRGILFRLRNAALMLFMLSTYLIVPVLGFAGIFTVMGIAQTKPEERWTKLLYLACLAALTVAFSLRWLIFVDHSA